MLGVQGLRVRFKVHGLGLSVDSSGFRVQDLGFEIGREVSAWGLGLGFRVQGSRFRVEG